MQIIIPRNRIVEITQKGKGITFLVVSGEPKTTIYKSEDEAKQQIARYMAQLQDYGAIIFEGEDVNSDNR